jgi:charged multivesicular body protein 3
MQTMREMSREMMKVGIIDEMIEETMESLEPEELEEKAQVRQPYSLFQQERK